MSPEIRHELTRFIVDRPQSFEFSCGCKAFTESDDPNFIWLCSPYGVESAISAKDGRELKDRLQNYLKFWSENRNEKGDLLL